MSDSDAKQNHLEIQRALHQLSTAELQQNLSKTNSETVRGWLELALAEKNRQPSPSADRSQKSPHHRQPPDTTAAGSTLQPAQIALLLPLSGKLANFGAAVRDGFLAALYTAKNNGEAVPVVRVYDTEGATVVALYQQALSEGATLVIGPLEKNQVAQFYAQPLPVPLLALNRAETNQPPPANLYQLALAPEDETAAIADFARKDNRANVLIIASEDEAHSRELEAFSQRWQSQGGTVAATALFRDQQGLSSAIRTALNIPRSEARSKEMESLLNRNIEFTPHRRRDIDMVFMLAKPTQARLIKPLLDFYYAGDLPIYSTSRIYAGYSVANQDRDAEKVRFTEIPLVLQSSPLKQQILADRPASKNYLRLYALGIDSFNLYPHLRQMETASDVRINGQIGTLTLDAQRIVQRTLPLAEMRGGIPRVLDSNGTLAQPTDTGNDTNRDDNVDQQPISSPQHLAPLVPNSGSAAEIAAANWLEQQGLALVEKNYRCKGGEIDLIMRAGSDLIFVEVRLRNRNDYGSAAESVTATKQRRIVCAAQHFLAAHPRWQNSSCRFDVVATHDATQASEWQWLRHAFLAE